MEEGRQPPARKTPTTIKHEQRVKAARLLMFNQWIADALRG